MGLIGRVYKKPGGALVIPLVLYGDGKLILSYVTDDKHIYFAEVGVFNSYAEYMNVGEFISYGNGIFIDICESIERNLSEEWNECVGSEAILNLTKHTRKYKLGELLV